MSTPTTIQVQTDSAATHDKLAASAAITEAAHADLHGNSSLAKSDRNEFVREMLTLIYVCAVCFHPSLYIDLKPNVIDGVRVCKYHSLFHLEIMVTDKEDAALYGS